MVNSREKGARFERRLAAILREYGFEARRGQQYCGANGDADVVGLPGVHIEAKHVERMNLYEWIAQAKRDAKQGELPAVFHKKNNEEILVTMTLDAWITLYREYNARVEITEKAKEQMCEEHCRFPYILEDQEELNDKCAACPINILGGGCYGN